MRYSNREVVSHVVRRLGIGSRPDLVASLDDPDEAIAAALDLRAPTAEPPDIPAPSDPDQARSQGIAQQALGWWFAQMLTSPRLVEERLIWFWHDHFATSLRKVQNPYLMWQQHLTLRRLATGNFGDLLRAVSKDPAMLFYLDGVGNRRGHVNENYGREVMELFTMGRGPYTEDDVVAAARSFTGWVVHVPGRTDRPLPGEPWSSLFVPMLHDDGEKTLLGVTGRHDMDDALDLILDRPETAERIASELYTALVGLPPDAATAARLGAGFGRNYEVMPLVESIVAEAAFVSGDAVRSRVRTPLERAAGIVQGFGGHEQSGRALFAGLEAVGYVPFNPPNVAGFPEGPRLLGPHTLVHAFDLIMAARPRQPDRSPAEVFARLGVHDVSDTSLDVVAGVRSPLGRIALAAASPEYALT